MNKNGMSLKVINPILYVPIEIFLFNKTRRKPGNLKKGECASLLI
jgi:hypothetical protein